MTERASISAILSYSCIFLQKLLDGTTMLKKEDWSHSLACLSVRFALDFNADATARDVSIIQVERHMRLCLAATAGQERFVTIAGSEPLLAEAAYQLVQESNASPVRHLANHVDVNCVNHGKRGELVATFLIMQALDAARAETTSNRWVSMDSFIKHLLPPSTYKILQKANPTYFRKNECTTFKSTFKGHSLWFNHVIKAEKKKKFSAEHLWKYITRGAMVLCVPNEEGVDIVLPVCNSRNEALSRHNVTAILIQVKNSEEYQSTIHKALYDKMNPKKLGLFPGDVTPKPIVRIVFTLASRKARVTVSQSPQRTTRHSQPSPHTAFDIWVAGLSTDAYQQIADDEASYRFLLDRSIRNHDAFQLLDDPKIDKETRRERGFYRRMMAPLTSTEDAHHLNHPVPIS